MISYTNIVKERFSNAAPRYDREAGLQEDVALELMDFMKRARAPKDFPRGMEHPRVLDIGCGTGRLMIKMREALRGVPVFGLDIALPMLKGAALRPGLWESAHGFVNSDCAALPFRDRTFELIVSNLAYQWVMGIERAFSEATRVLGRGGAFAFSTLGPKTLYELSSSLAGAGYGGERFTITPFAKTGEIEKALKRAGLYIMDIKEMTMVRSYESPLHLLKILKNTGATARGRIYGKGLSGGTFLRKAMNIYEKKFPAKEGGVRATYDVILVAAKKAG